jgi:hypothetical protein
MKTLKNYLYILFLTISLPCSAQQMKSWNDLEWVQISQSNNGEAYISRPNSYNVIYLDSANTQRNAGVVYGYMFNFTTPNPRFYNAKSVMYQMIFNCQNWKNQIQVMTYYSGSNAKGTIIEDKMPQDWETWKKLAYINSNAERMLSRACYEYFRDVR